MVGDVLHQLPLLSGALWVVVGLLPILKSRRRPLPPELAFIGFCLLLGSSALVDWVLLNSTNTSGAADLSNFRFSLTNSCILCFLLFAKWVTARRSRWDALFAGPTALSAALQWTVAVTGVVMEPWGPRVVRSPLYYGFTLIQALAYIGVAFFYIIRALRIIRIEDKALARRMTVLLVTMTLVLTVASTTIANNLVGAPDFPLLSPLLFIPAALMLGFLAALDPKRAQKAVNRVVLSGGRRVLGACLLDNGGQLVGLAAPGRRNLGRFGGLPDVMSAIDDFISTGFGTQRQRLQTVVVGSVTLLVARGQKYTLVLALQGPYHDFLRPQLEKALGDMEQGSFEPGTTEAKSPAASAALDNFLLGLMHPA